MSAPAPAQDKKLAVMAEVLYLCNLLLLPGIAFLWLLLLNVRYSSGASPLALCHLRQTLAASIWAGVLLIPITGLTVMMGGYQSVTGWTVAILYFIVCHASLVLLGVVGLAKAMAGLSWRYPLIGPVCGSHS
jgi:SNF family Na+-dependent transporter